MVLDIKHWVTAPVKLEVVEATLDNLSEIASWTGASKITIESPVPEGVSPKKVILEFLEYRPYQDALRFHIGDFVAFRPACFDEWGSERQPTFYVIKTRDIHKFRRSEIEIAAPYDR